MSMPPEVNVQSTTTPDSHSVTASDFVKGGATFGVTGRSTVDLPSVYSI